MLTDGSPATRVMSRFRLLDVEVDAADAGMLGLEISSAIAAGRRIVIANHNLHSIRLHRGSAELRAYYASADIVHIDGMPIVWIAQLLGLPVERRHRTTYVDWLPALMASAEREGWRVFYCGSRPGVAERGLEVLRRRFPRLEARASHGYLDEPGGLTSHEVLAQIDAFRPHLLFVGMGMPRQELWIREHRERLTANVILPCGAAIDYVAGAVPTPPRWLGPLGMEWVFRLASEPRRLARRYLVEPWSLVVPILRDVVAGRVRSSRARG